MTKPVRLRLSRAKGFNLQAVSIGINGLFAKNVSRPGKHGNPFYPGCGIGYGGFNPDGTLRWADVSLPRVQVRWFRWKMEEMQQHFPSEFEAYIAPLRGRNLACWCKLEAPFCHADVLLELANPMAKAEAA